MKKLGRIRRRRRRRKRRRGRRGKLASYEALLLFIKVGIYFRVVSKTIRTFGATILLHSTNCKTKQVSLRLQF